MKQHGGLKWARIGKVKKPRVGMRVLYYQCLSLPIQAAEIRYSDGPRRHCIFATPGNTFPNFLTALRDARSRRSLNNRPWTKRLSERQALHAGNNGSG